ncbi:pentapeptide repeat-containing protein [Aquimarina longa]|uniref:pentapeptide repeat-containing protein n=1 Tax=Aquimarina longa TaxID=1080221 RepID=UPI000781A71F|nr:pentapeptide repeat-containing protein [Aquimarina longa]
MRSNLQIYKAVNEQDYIEQLKSENKLLQDKLDKINKAKQKKRKFRRWLIKKSSTPIFGNRLKKSISNAITEYKDSKAVSVDTVSDVSSSVIWRITRVGLFAFLFAIVPSLVLIFQTKLLMNQNKLINNQTSLIEADRRSSLVFVLSDVLADLNEELKYKGSGSRNISKTLESRIVSLCMAMKPYRYIDNGELIKDPISPERGQLLFTLLKSDLGLESSQDILNSAEFKYTNLRKVNLGRGVNLKYARLDYSNFTEVQMPAANLESSDLKEVNMSRVNLSDANLKRARLHNANLKHAELLSVNLTNANLFGVDLTGADLSEAILWGAKLENANLTDVILDNVVVDRQDWITYVSDSLDLKGSGALENKYRVKKQGKKQFMLVPRK